MIPVLVINRTQDTERLAAFAASAAGHGVSFDRIEAVDGHAPGALAPYRDLIGPHFWGEDTAKPGALGCFLSHMRAWQAVVDRGLACALICEDDAVMYKTPAALPSHIDDLPNTDIVFVNQRLVSWTRAVAASGARPLAEVVATLARMGGPTAKGLKPTPGGDGYLLTASGARYLLDLVSAQKIVCGVDWAMVWSSLPGVSEEIALAFPELSILRQHAALPVRPLRSVVLTEAFLDQSGQGGSTIKHRVTVPISSLRPSQS